jgi:putative SOS response-associated peptidase YedK
MCYSAQIQASYDRYVRANGADIDIKQFVKLYWLRSQGAKINIPKAVDAWFDDPKTDAEREIHRLIVEFNAQQATKYEQDLFKQRKRLADAERTLQTKTTKKALEDKRIGAEKAEWNLEKLAALRRTELVPDDSRIFPGWYAPVMVMEHGRHVVKPMRYQCRLANLSAESDRQFAACYNARRDNLEGFWGKQFGTSHAIIVANAFFENVKRHKKEGRELAAGEEEENLILEFRPRPQQEMLVACIWSHWKQGDDELLSFAAITDDPPAEVAAAGHDRCIIPITEANIDAWLKPDAKNLKAQYAILDDRARPYYEHRLAA